MIGEKSMMKKIDKKDILCCTFLVIIFLIFVFIITQFKYYYGSTLDWEAQHINFPDYFRTLFYKTGDFLPDFAFNIGNGQNIYNFSYYGLLSPIVLLSYLLPMVPMIDYLCVISILSVIVSTLMMYCWLRKNHKGSYLQSFLASLAFMFATSMTLHSHRHIMFVNYMPFLVLGLFGVDKRLNEKKGWLLSLSVFLMVMTSYYYSISGIICLIVYGIYIYIMNKQEIRIKNFILDGLQFVLPIIIGVLCSAVLIIPTFYVILNGRGETFNVINIKDLFIPSVNVKYMLYNSYGMGLTSLAFVSIVNLLLNKREKKFLGVVLLLLVLFPFMNYILNATMYIDAKILIPMLPLAVLAIYQFLKDFIELKINLKKLYIFLLILAIGILLKGNIAKAFFLDFVILTLFVFLYKKFKKQFILAIPCILIPFCVSLAVSFRDNLVNHDKYNNERSINSELVKNITDNDKSFYRISNMNNPVKNMNNIYSNIDYLSSTVYSSTYNIGYNRFYFDIINNPISSRNRVIMSSTTNLMYLLFSGNKYLITKNAPFYGYKLITSVGENNIYRSEDVLPLMFARSSILNENEFDTLDYPFMSEALLNNVVVDKKSTHEFKSNIYKVNFDLNKINFSNLKVEKENDYFLIKADKNARGTYTFNQDLKNKLIFIRFNVLESAKCSHGDTSIEINGVKNKLTCQEWKYHNQNYVFDYVLSRNDLEELEIIFSEGNHKINGIEIFALDYSDIKNIKNDVDVFHFDKEKTFGDYIEGKIDVKESGYFVTSIPYERGFQIMVDNKITDYVNVNKGFVGFEISEGHHDVKIEYKAPFKMLALAISGISIIVFIGLTIFENKKY